MRQYIQAQGANLTSRDLLRLTPGGVGAQNLSFGQNMRVLGEQARGLTQGGAHKAPGRILGAAWRGSLGSGGNFAMGSGLRARYIPQGARLGMATALVPEAMSATKAIDPTGAGRSRTERVGGVVGGALGNLLAAVPASVSGRFGVAGMPAQMALGAIGQSAGKRVGAAVGRLTDKAVSKVRGVTAGDESHALVRPTPRRAGSNAV